MFSPIPSARFVAVGSGGDGMNETVVCDAIVRLSGKDRPNVLYIGTAQYDLAESERVQTVRFAERGCSVTRLAVANSTPTQEEIDSAFADVEVIVLSGGNTLFALDRLIRLGVHERLRQAMTRGVVLSGGSAGAICWFDAGHSDSMDPDSYKKVKLATQSAADDSAAPVSEDAKKNWEYIRVPCLGFLPGLCCPHHDKIQSNGILRAVDFDAMLLRHPGETGICLDHWAALVIEGEEYRIIYPEGKEGSVAGDPGKETFSAERLGRPGIWRKFVRDGLVSCELVPMEGKIADLLVPASEVQPDPRVVVARAENPDDLA